MKWYWVILCVIGFVFVCLFFVRLVGSRYIDDVNPLMNCSVKYLEKSDVFYVVPYFDGFMINESRNWCDFILSLDKEIGMHGVRHSYKEFGSDVSARDIELGMDIFESCFGFRPERFKAPQLKLSSRNREILKYYGFSIDGKKLYFFHKIYHCNNGGILPNIFYDFI